MTTSVTWTLNAEQALQRAYLMIGALTAPDYSLSNFQLAQGLTVANATLKAMATWGNNIFRRFPASLTVSAGVPTVPIPNDIMDVIEARWVVSTLPLYERPLGRFTWTDYFNLPTKNASGAPVLYMFDYQQDSTQLYVWMVNPLSGTINCTIVRRANDIVLPTDPIDLPSEWLDGYVYLLADALVDDQGLADMNPGNVQHIKERALYWTDKMQNFDRPSSIFFRAWGKKGVSPYWR